jgi:hypothetical protein
VFPESRNFLGQWGREIWASGVLPKHVLAAGKQYDYQQRASECTPKMQSKGASLQPIDRLAASYP